MDFNRLEIGGRWKEGMEEGANLGQLGLEVVGRPYDQYDYLP